MNCTNPDNSSHVSFMSYLLSIIPRKATYSICSLCLLPIILCNSFHEFGMLTNHTTQMLLSFENVLLIKIYGFLFYKLPRSCMLTSRYKCILLRDLENQFCDIFHSKKKVACSFINGQSYYHSLHHALLLMTLHTCNL